MFEQTKSDGTQTLRGWNLPPLWLCPPWLPLPQANPSSWQGELSGAAATVLCLHGAQNDLSPLQLAVL